MDKRNTWYGQPVTDAELDEIQDLIEKGIGATISDTTGQTRGVCGTDMVPYEATPPANTVKVPVGAAYADEVNATTKKVPSRWAAIQTVNCAVDYLAASTQPAGGKERYLSIFVKFVRAESDPKTDLHGNALYYDQDESFVFQVRQTADAVYGAATPVAAPGTNYVRVCDIRVTDTGWGTISNPVDPEDPGNDEIDYTGVDYLASYEARQMRKSRRTMADAMRNEWDGDLQRGVRRQAIVNGNLDVWQRGVSFAAATAAFAADRFYFVESTDGAATVARDTSVPSLGQSGRRSTYSLKVTVTGADAAIGAGQYSQLQTCVEGIDFRALNKRQATLSFWVKSDKIGIYCVTFQSGVLDAYYTHEYEIYAAGTWEKKKVTLTFDDGAGTWAEDNTTGVRILWALAVGATWNIGDPDAWYAGNHKSTVNQVNLFDATNYWQIAQVQLNAGSVALPVLERTPTEELALCQRYYEKSYEIETAPGTTTDLGLWRGNVALVLHTNGASIYCGLHPRFRVSKRGTPTIVLVNNNGTAAQWNIGGARAVTSGDIATGGFAVLWNEANDTPAGPSCYGHWTADAELT